MPPRETERVNTDATYLLPLSAHSPAALRAMIDCWVAFLSQTAASIGEICFTAAVRRTHRDYRIAVTGASKEEIRARLETLPSEALLQSRDPARRSPQVGFVFCGQGPQWHAMGQQLLVEEPVFRDTVVSCDELLRPLAQWSLIEELNRPESESRLADTEIAQPALFAVQAGLAALWRSWGVIPSAVVGHSVGEIAALHIAGVLSLAEAIRIVWLRGRIMAQAKGNGRMAAIGVGAEEAARLITSYPGRLDIAAVNGPRNIVLSGEMAALEEVLATVRALDISQRWLPGDYAFHSTQMESLATEFKRQLGRVRVNSAALPIYSTVSGARADDTSFDANYFGRNVREPVLFMKAMQAMIEGCDVLVEIGPQPVLAASIAECSSSNHTPAILASLRRGHGERASMLRSCAEVYAAGHDLNWNNLQPGPGQIVDLPSYPWQRKRHWINVPEGKRTPAVAQARHLLGTPLAIPGLGASVFEVESSAVPEWIADHRVQEKILLPAAAVIEAFSEAARRSGRPSSQLVNFTMHRALTVPEQPEAPSRWQVTLKPLDAENAFIEWYAAKSDASSDLTSWERIASAQIEALVSTDAVLVDPPMLNSVPSASIYAEFTSIGAAFGPAFRTLQSVERTDGFARAIIDWPVDSTSPDSSGVPAVLIDAAIQLSLVAAAGDSERALPESLYLPIGADRVIVSPGPLAGAVIRARGRLTPGGASLTADVRIDGVDGSTRLRVDGLQFARAHQGQAIEQFGGLRYEIGWQEATGLADSGNAAGAWLIFADRSGIADALCERIRADGGLACTVLVGSSFQEISENHFVFDPAQPEQFRKLLSIFASRDQTIWRGVVYCWSLDTGQENGATADGAFATEAALQLVQALTSSLKMNVGALTVVTRGAAIVTGAEAIDRSSVSNAGLWALGAVIAAEHPDLEPHTIDLDPQLTAEDTAAFHAEIFDGAEQRVAIREGKRWVPRLRRPVSRSGKSIKGPISAELTRGGTFEGIDLVERSRMPLGPDDVRLEVSAAGVNFRDVLLTLGLYPGSKVPLGAECAGRVVEIGSAVRGVSVGDRVMGYVSASLATEATATASALLPIPDGMSAEVAAGLPVAFMTALYGLETIAQLRKGQRVLIHAAAGGVGLAAMQLAKQRGAEIFATAGSTEKRALVQSLGAAHVFEFAFD